MLLDFEFDQNIELICDVCRKKTSPGKAKEVYAEHAYLVAERDRIPVREAAQWLMIKAGQYYQLVQDTWGKDKKYCKTPRYFFEDKVYAEDPQLITLEGKIKYREVSEEVEGVTFKSSQDFARVTDNPEVTQISYAEICIPTFLADVSLSSRLISRKRETSDAYANTLVRIRGKQPSSHSRGISCPPYSGRQKTS